MCYNETYPPRRRRMNVLNIPKQINTLLRYSKHAKDRAEMRDVPLPKYVPLDSRCVKREWNKELDNYTYTLEYKFNEIEYHMVVADDMMVVTVFRKGFFSQKSIKQVLDERRAITKTTRKPDKYVRANKYRHHEVQKGIQQYYSCA